MSDQLDYQGARVRLQADSLSLTDMWKAAGSPANKLPYDWQRLPQVTEFIDYIVDTAGKSRSLVVWTKEGRGGGTWAHWQIGLAYAKYLSPAFHAWCNSIVRAHMERRASGNFQQQVIERLDRIEHRVDTLEQRLPQRRREITKTTRLRLADATLALGGRCPCCGRLDVVDADGNVVNAEFDHFYSNQLPSEDHSWLICLSCHSRLTTGALPRTEADVHFKSFQLRRAALIESPDANDLETEVIEFRGFDLGNPDIAAPSTKRSGLAMVGKPTQPRSFPSRPKSNSRPSRLSDGAASRRPDSPPRRRPGRAASRTPHRARSNGYLLTAMRSST